MTPEPDWDSHPAIPEHTQGCGCLALLTILGWVVLGAVIVWLWRLAGE